MQPVAPLDALLVYQFSAHGAHPYPNDAEIKVPTTAVNIPRAHFMQSASVFALEPAEPNVPVGHNAPAHLVCPTTALYMPDPQSVHSAVPPVPYRPTGQAVHTGTSGGVLLNCVPAGQAWAMQACPYGRWSRALVFPPPGVVYLVTAAPPRLQVSETRASSQLAIL